MVFSPVSAGGKEAAVNIPSNDPDEAEAQVTLAGTGIAVVTPAGDSGSLPVGPLAAGISALLVWWKRRKQRKG